MNNATPQPPLIDLVDPVRATFKEAMAHMACPVSIATAMDGSRPHGTTVSAIMSLSMDPELFLISLSTSSDLLGVVAQSGRFGVNILSVDQTDLAMGFAQKGPSKFDGVAWDVSHDLPRIREVCTWMALSVRQSFVEGDHVMVVGAVEAVDDDPDRRPLVYQGRRFAAARSL